MKLLNQIQDIFYDILGFLIPGFIMVILCMPFLFYHYSFAYYIYTKGPVSFLFELQSIVSAHSSWFTLFLICVIAYLLGTFLLGLPVFLRSFFSKLPKRKQVKKKKKWFHLSKWIRNKVNSYYPYMNKLEAYTYERLKSDTNANPFTTLDKEEAPIGFMKTYASANSGFEQTHTNASKYKSKQIFFRSMRIITGIVLADFILTGIFYTARDFIFLLISLKLVWNESRQHFIDYWFFSVRHVQNLVAIPFLKKMICSFVIYLFYGVSIHEEMRHEILYQKELYLYLNYMIDQKETK